MSKNAVSMVEELCAKRGQRPKFTEMQLPNQVPPVFRVVCEVNLGSQVYTTTGNGNAKKSARLKACEVMLQKLKQDVNNPDVKRISGFTDNHQGKDKSAVASVHNPNSASTSSEPANKLRKLESLDDKEVGLIADEMSEYARNGNPSDDLIRFCKQYELPEPNSSDGPVSGPPHRRLFTMKYAVDTINFNALGVHLDKKKARRIAAEKMLTELKRKLKNGEIKSIKTNVVSFSSGENYTSKLKSLLLTERKFPTYDYSGIRDTLRTKECSHLQNVDGPFVKSLLEFSSEINKKYPFDVKPEAHFKAWLMSHETGIAGFFHGVQNELSMLVTTSVRPMESQGTAAEERDNETIEQDDYCDVEEDEDSDENCDEDDQNETMEQKENKAVYEDPSLSKPMIVLEAKIPRTENRQPVIIKFNDDVEEGLRDCMVELLMYLGLLSVS